MGITIKPQINVLFTQVLFSLVPHVERRERYGKELNQNGSENEPYALKGGFQQKINSSVD